MGLHRRRSGIRAYRSLIDKRLYHAEGSYNSVNGVISVSWKVAGKSAEISVTVPVKTLLHLPNGEEKQLEKGSYSYTVEI